MPDAVAFITPDHDAVIAEVEIAAPPSRVFSALIDEGALMQWFAGDASCPTKFWKMDARKGGSYSYATRKGTFAVNGIDEFECHGEIIEYDPPRLLVYTWSGNWHVDKARTTVVRWGLTATAAGTHVKVTHSGLAEEAAARKDYSNGWVGVINNLRQFVERGSMRHEVGVGNSSQRQS